MLDVGRRQAALDAHSAVRGRGQPGVTACDDRDARPIEALARERVRDGERQPARVAVVAGGPPSLDVTPPACAPLSDGGIARRVERRVRAVAERHRHDGVATRRRRHGDDEVDVVVKRDDARRLHGNREAVDGQTPIEDNLQTRQFLDENNFNTIVIFFISYFKLFVFNFFFFFILNTCQSKV